MLLVALVMLGAALFGRTRKAVFRSTTIALTANAIAVLSFLFVFKKTTIYGDSLSLGFSAAYCLTTLGLGGVLLYLVKLGFRKDHLVEREARGRAPKIRAFFAFIAGAIL